MWKFVDVDTDRRLVVSDVNPMQTTVYLKTALWFDLVCSVHVVLIRTFCFDSYSNFIVVWSTSPVTTLDDMLRNHAHVLRKVEGAILSEYVIADFTPTFFLSKVAWYIFHSTPVNFRLSRRQSKFRNSLSAKVAELFRFENFLTFWKFSFPLAYTLFECPITRAEN